MRLKYLAISDTHLGEETSLLCFPQGRWHLAKELRRLFGQGEQPVAVDTLVLVGDIADRTLSSTAQIITYTNALMYTLLATLKVRRIVYVPGNHDHTMWSAYHRQQPDARCSPPGGELLIDHGSLVDSAVGHSDESGRSALLETYLGWPLEPLWQTVKEQELQFVIANPLFAERYLDRTYVFTHGTHFRRDVNYPRAYKKIVHALGIDKLLGGLDLEVEAQPLKRAKSLVELETLATPFVDSLWASSRSEPTSRADGAWYLLTYLSGKFDSLRTAPTTSERFSWSDLSALDQGSQPSRVPLLTAPAVDPKQGAGKGRGKGRGKAHESIVLMQNIDFLGHAATFVEAAGVPWQNVNFVYGDTHFGGFGSLPHRGTDVRIVNTGAWVVHNKDDHPPCHIFAVDETGGQYLADLSFAALRIDDVPLLELAAADAEHRKRSTSRLFQIPLEPWVKTWRDFTEGGEGDLELDLDGGQEVI